MLLSQKKIFFLRLIVEFDHIWDQSYCNQNYYKMSDGNLLIQG